LEKPFTLLSKCLSKDKTRASLRSVCGLSLALQGSKCVSLDSNIKKVQYIRYLDHFILAITGEKKFAYQVLICVSLFLNGLGLKLSAEKSGVKHYEKGVLFLRHNIVGKYATDVL
jgi:hypothetical protein